MIYPARGKSGFSIVEMLIVVVIATTVIILTYELFGTGQRQFKEGLDRSYLQSDGRQVVARLTRELRQATQITQASLNSITFYANILPASEAPEQITYRTSGTNLLRDIIESTGEPPVWNEVDKKTLTLTTYFRNDPTLTQESLFRYYNNTNPPQEVSQLDSIYLIKIFLKLDNDPDKLPPAFSIESSVQIRNKLAE